MIKRFSESSERQLHRLLSEVELGDKKPSQLLRQMRDLGRNQATDNLLKTKWMSLLPSHLMENSNGNVMEVETTNSQEVHSIKNPPAKQSDDRLDKLENMILELQKSVRQLLGTNKATFQENRSRSRSRPQFRSADGTCYYHLKFGEAAYKCQRPWCTKNRNHTPEN
ncbi:GSCOCG00012394001-RA-CDS [Cotesia congregata]|nr:GSCOCG00012394001-RA-CDS [Cotesia congregata]